MVRKTRFPPYPGNDEVGIRTTVFASRKLRKHNPTTFELGDYSLANGNKECLGADSEPDQGKVPSRDAQNENHVGLRTTHDQ